MPQRQILALSLSGFGLPANATGRSKMDNRSAKSSTKPVIVGTGLLALDVVIADNVATDPMLCAGGTCGNVLTALAFLGWQAYPIARLKDDAASKRVIEDLKSWKVKLDFVLVSENGSTPVVVQHIRERRNRERSHSFSRKCPACGTWLPWYKAVRAATVPDLTPRLPKANVFYFDRTSRGAVRLAENARRDGALVVFEPSSESHPALLNDAIAAAHVVKVASNRLSGNEALLKAREPILIIETLGSEGLRFALKATGRRTWRVLPAFRVDRVLDSAAPVTGARLA
jgi:sugar/nucleoside kinase (ribokinase family)